MPRAEHRTSGFWKKLYMAFLRLALLLVVGFVTLSSASPLFSQQELPALPKPSAVLAVSELLNEYWIANRAGAEDNVWSRAVYFNGNMAHCQVSRESRYAAYAWNWAE